MSSAARSARTPSSPTTPAATGIARSARGRQHGNGWPSARRSCCRSPTITSYSPCRLGSPISPIRTRPSSTTCCSRHHPRPCSPLLPTPSISAPWGAVRSSYLGVRAHPPSSRAHDRAGRWLLTRRKALGLMPATLLPVSGRAVSLVPPVVPGQAPHRSSGRCAAVLRQACPTDRSASIRRLSGAVVEHKLGRLLQAPLRRTEGGAALSRALHPP